MKEIRLPGATVAFETTDDAFQVIADRINGKVRKLVGNELRYLARNGIEPDDGSGFGPTVVAAIAAMVNAAGYLAESFEPHVRGEVVAGTVLGQFNAGREDFRLHHRSSVQ